MLEDVKNARERWGGVHTLIDRWLRERQVLIVQYCDLTATTAFANVEQVRGKFVRLCELLLDYVSAGHFEVYQKLIQEAKEFDDGGVELVSKVYPRIESTTEVALAFNDRLEGRGQTEEDLRALMEPLSNLGEDLETRFELEDFLIEHLHNAHAEAMSST
jgi:regulator of sigma D